MKFLWRRGPIALRSGACNILRMGSTDDPCSFKHPESSPTPPSSKAEPCQMTKSVPSSTCPELPPCPPMPQCPPTICPTVPDPNNPCNYTPPPCPDPDAPDLRRLKKFQCMFQADDGIPLYLKKGKLDALLYQSTIVMVIVGLLAFYYNLFKVISN